MVSCGASDFGSSFCGLFFLSGRLLIFNFGSLKTSSSASGKSSYNGSPNGSFKSISGSSSACVPISGVVSAAGSGALFSSCAISCSIFCILFDSEPRFGFLFGLLLAADFEITGFSLIDVSNELYPES